MNTYLYKLSKSGGSESGPVIIAGPCAVESYKQFSRIAKKVKGAGADMLRGDAFKARTSPHSFQGLGMEGLKIIKQVSTETGLPTVTEVLDTREVEVVLEYTDVLKIGSRNMQNYALLREVGKTNKPVMLKRGSGATIREFLLAAEYILNEGNDTVILCVRGIRTFENATRYSFDLDAVPLLQKSTNLPIIADPSHASGHSDLVPQLSLAAIAAGANGLLLEIHDDPGNALCDGQQAISVEIFKNLVDKIKKITMAIGKKVKS